MDRWNLKSPAGNARYKFTVLTMTQVKHEELSGLACLAWVVWPAWFGVYGGYVCSL